MQIFQTFARLIHLSNMLSIQTFVMELPYNDNALVLAICISVSFFIIACLNMAFHGLCWLQMDLNWSPGSQVNYVNKDFNLF